MYSLPQCKVSPTINHTPLYIILHCTYFCPGIETVELLQQMFETFELTNKPNYSLGALLYNKVVHHAH